MFNITFRQYRYKTLRGRDFRTLSVTLQKRCPTMISRCFQLSYLNCFMNHFDNIVTKYLVDVIYRHCQQHSKTLLYNNFTMLTDIIFYMFDEIIEKCYVNVIVHSKNIIVKHHWYHCDNNMC